RVLFVCLMFASQTAYAVEINHLYETEVIANSEQEHDRVTAIRQALTIVLTRVLAGNNILQDDTVKAVLANATDYVSEFQYSLIATNEQKNNNARLMRVQFDEMLLVDVLRPGKLGYWNETRSRTLVWLVVEKEGKQQFFDAGLMPDIDAAMDKASRQKALPILYPIQDLREKRTLSISDVLSAYSEHLLEVSLRYDVVSTLAGKMVQVGACWKAEWTLYFDAKIEQWRSPCSSIDNVALSGLQGAYDGLSTYYAVKPNIKEISSIVFKVSNIKNINAMQKVTDYLETLPMIKTVTWVTTESGYNVYRIFYQGTRQTLNNKLADSNILRAEDFPLEETKAVKYKLLSN
ncbi:MAG: DUF2066 domain-containing protein, partial [Methylococcales bacterium]|nr:DUF2066 domain-containing protein [Methylococcales bacterium]